MKVITDLADSHKPQPRGSGLLTIRELAERSGMSVRNIREWQTLGLLPRAGMSGRTGYYEPAVVDRIERIRQLHAEGFPLDLIRRMLEASRGAGEDVMQLAHVLRAPFREEGAPVLDRDEWASTWGGGAKELRRAIAIGLVRERADGRLEFASARIARMGETLRALGLSTAEILDASAEIRLHLESIAALFEALWLRHVWEPFLEAGMPENRLPGLQATVAQVQPLARGAVEALFTVAMEAQIEQGIAREVARAAGRGSRTRRKKAS